MDVHLPEMSDLAVIAKTGKTWAQWFDVLDKAGARRLDHKAIARLLGEKFRVGPWWRRMVTAEYERARGLRHETAPGFSVSISKTMAVEVSRLFTATTGAHLRRKWFPKGALKVSSQTENKHFRAAWNGQARLEINFYARPGGKAQVVVQVNRLAQQADVEHERSMWKKALVKLEAQLID
jgi:hypothetical protein